VDDSIVVEQFKALGEPVRWAIVRELRTGTRCASELSDVAKVSAPLLSHHLKVLRGAGLIAGTKRGRWIDYTLDNDALHNLFSHTQPNTAPSTTPSPQAATSPATSKPRPARAPMQPASPNRIDTTDDESNRRR
jgi:ArsR family transcriptional regulator